MSAPVAKRTMKGQTYRRELPAISTNGASSKSIHQAGNVSLGDVKVLTQADWIRIQNHLHKSQTEEERLRKQHEERIRLHEMSQEKIKNWTNTVFGQRQKKLEARRQREEQEEEERKLLDVEEAKFQAEQRREAIERAKTQQYFQTDRLKGFHSALLLTEVLKEREAQVELKKLKEKMNNGADRDLREKAEQEYHEFLQKDLEEKRRQAEMNKMTAEFQKAQIEDRHRQSEREKEEGRIEAEELERLKAQYREELRKLDELRQQESKHQMAENLQQIEDKKFMKHIDKMQEEQEDEDCRVFATAKKKIMRMRAEKEREIMMEKQEQLEKIREKLAAQFKQTVDDEDDRIKRAIEEKEARKAKEEEEKETKRKKMINSIKDHRREQDELGRRQKEEQRLKELESLKARQEADAVFAANEAEKQLRRQDEAKHISKLYLDQAEERRRLEQQHRERDLEQEQRNRELLELEERQFQEYAQAVIDNSERRGRKTLPLHRAAREGAGGGLGPVFPGRGPIRPSYLVADGTGAQLPNYQRYSTDETKKNIGADALTCKRLGFVW